MRRNARRSGRNGGAIRWEDRDGSGIETGDLGSLGRGDCGFRGRLRDNTQARCKIITTPDRSRHIELPMTPTPLVDPMYRPRASSIHRQAGASKDKKGISTHLNRIAAVVKNNNTIPSIQRSIHCRRRIFAFASHPTHPYHMNAAGGNKTMQSSSTENTIFEGERGNSR